MAFCVSVHSTEDEFLLALNGQMVKNVKNAGVKMPKIVSNACKTGQCG